MTETVVENHEGGLLQIEGRLTDRLTPGRRTFWVAGRKIEVNRLDLRPQRPRRRIGTAVPVLLRVVRPCVFLGLRRAAHLHLTHHAAEQHVRRSRVCRVRAQLSESA